MERTPVDSETLVSVGYDAASSTLELEFRSSGRIYRFDGVPASVHAWLMRTPTKGSYFNKMIRDVYPYRDVTPGLPPRDLAEDLRRSLEQLED